MDNFYENTLVLDNLKKKIKPQSSDLNRVLSLIKDNAELTRYFYDKNEQGALSVGWLESLDGVGEFEVLNGIEASNKPVPRVKAVYLVHCAKEKAEEVLKIIKKIKAKDEWIQGKLTEAILQMPEKEAGLNVSVVLDYLKERENKVWYFVGEPAAKLMVKLAKTNPDKVFELAWVLVDAWEATDEYKLKDMVAKFEEHNYEELIFKYYNKLFEIDAFRATGILLKILERHVEEASKRDDYDVSSHYYISIENLEEIDRGYAGVLAVLVKGICEGGRAVIEKQPDKVNELLSYLEDLNKAIFDRIAMYVLRFVPKGAETERISRFIGNKKYFGKMGYEYEYKYLLRDKFVELKNKTVSEFMEWVKNIKKSTEDRKEIEEWCKENEKPVPDFDKMENYLRAEELYLVRDKFKDIYQEYVKKAGVKDDNSLAPQRMVGEARHVSQTEWSPITQEKMEKMEPEEVLDYILEPKNYEGQNKEEPWHTKADGLRATFKWDIKKRPIEYLKCSLEKLVKIPAEFMSALFYGVQDSVRDGSFTKSGWCELIDLAEAVVQNNINDAGYQNCFSTILGTLRDGFGDRDNAIEWSEEIVRHFWEILDKLVRYEYDRVAKGNEDPMQSRCVSVQGEALEQTISLGIVSKKRFEKMLGEELRDKIRSVWSFAAGEVKRAEINCTFGIEFSRMYWLDSEWVEENIEQIFAEDMWDTVWGTYTSWGRPSIPGFKLLVDKGKYEQAVKLLGEGHEYKFEFRKEPNEGLAEHLMIGYFNGWIGFSDCVLVSFFEAASAELRGKAVRFLATGFKSTKEEGGKYAEEVSVRIKEFWEKRLDVMKNEPQANLEEAVGFTVWVEDSILEPKETLELLERTLDLTEGRLGRHRDTRAFVKGISELAAGNELLALSCLKMAVVDDNMQMVTYCEKELMAIFEQIMELDKNHPDVNKIWEEAAKVADSYGRLYPDKFRSVWKQLKDKQTPQ